MGFGSRDGWGNGEYIGVEFGQISEIFVMQDAILFWNTIIWQGINQARHVKDGGWRSWPLVKVSMLIKMMMDASHEGHNRFHCYVWHTTHVCQIIMINPEHKLHNTPHNTSYNKNHQEHVSNLHCRSSY